MSILGEIVAAWQHVQAIDTALTYGVDVMDVEEALYTAAELGLDEVDSGYREYCQGPWFDGAANEVEEIEWVDDGSEV